MKTENLPLISVVLNVYNEEKNIESCLRRIREQDYPQDRIEIIIVDDNSTDKTISIAKEFEVKVIKSGFRNRERAKSIGLEKVRGKYVLLMDADVLLLSNKWISQSVDLFRKNPLVSAIQNVRWHYDPGENIANRYCNLFGVNDPIVFYLGKRGALMAIEEEWPNKGKILQRSKNYCVVEFSVSNLPTMGAQGFIAKTEDILKTTWKPYFFHLDSIFELVEMGKNKFIMIDLEIEHGYAKSVVEFYTKLYRNLTLFLKLKKYRKYTYEVSSVRFLFAMFLMLSVVQPVYVSVRGFIKKPDLAWFLHPIFSFTVPILYSLIVVRHVVKKYE